MEDIEITDNLDADERNPSQFPKELSSRMTTITLDIPLRDTLKRLRQQNETYADVIRRLLGENTQLLGNQNVGLTVFARKTLFLQTDYKHERLGLEIEYNDIKSDQQSFTLDLKIKKVFFGRQVLNPTIFFGLDDAHKHYSPIFLNLYLKSVAFALRKELKVNTSMLRDRDFEDVALWRRVYYTYSLSEDSFKRDIEAPLRLSEEEKVPPEYQTKINTSIGSSLLKKSVPL